MAAFRAAVVLALCLAAGVAHAQPSRLSKAGPAMAAAIKALEKAQADGTLSLAANNNSNYITISESTTAGRYSECYERGEGAPGGPGARARGDWRRVAARGRHVSARRAPRVGAAPAGGAPYTAWPLSGHAAGRPGAAGTSRGARAAARRGAPRRGPPRRAASPTAGGTRPPAPRPTVAAGRPLTAPLPAAPAPRIHTVAPSCVALFQLSAHINSLQGDGAR